MKKFILVLSLCFAFSVHAEEKLSPVEIEITELTPKRGHVRVLSFFYDGKSCQVQTSSKNKKSEDISRCKKVVGSLNKELAEKAMPSDYINPKGSYWDVKLKTPENTWQQTVLKEKMSACDSAGKCSDAGPQPARTIAKTLLQEFVK